ncbi:hypothetical protein [Halodesulfovibrio aestuarii]|uniref:Uncharacterized protein n=1 Tax=Halodesulfovibrio aestuarii TaxID=126333 RepID=A0ABV4JNL2_9BACT
MGMNVKVTEELFESMKNDPKKLKELAKDLRAEADAIETLAESGKLETTRGSCFVGCGVGNLK